jgi:hypothetical protein
MEFVARARRGEGIRRSETTPDQYNVAAASFMVNIISGMAT